MAESNDFFRLEDAFADFETPEETQQRLDEEATLRRQERDQGKSTRRRLASEAGSSVARLGRSLSGRDPRREVQASKELQESFQKIAGGGVVFDTTGVSSAGVWSPEELEQMSQREQEIIQTVGPTAEARMVAQGMSEDEAQLAALDEVISQVQMPETARNLMVLKGALATQIRDRRSKISSLKSEAQETALDRRVTEAEAQKKEAEVEHRNIETLKLLQRKRELQRDPDIEPNDPEIQRIDARLDKLTGENAAAKDSAQDFGVGVINASIRAMQDSAEQQITTITELAKWRDQLVNAPNVNTLATAANSLSDRVLTEIEAAFPGSRENLEKLLDQAGLDPGEGQDAQVARQMGKLVLLRTTDAINTGIPSDFDVRNIQQVVGEAVANPAVRTRFINNLADAAITKFEDTVNIQDLGVPQTSAVAAQLRSLVRDRHQETFIDQDREIQSRGREAEAEEADNLEGRSLDDLFEEFDAARGDQ